MPLNLILALRSNAPRLLTRRVRRTLTKKCFPVANPNPRLV